MKKILLTFAILYSASVFSQSLFTENFESYSGFGTSLPTAWPTTNFKVYVNHGTSGSKGCGVLLNNIHKLDSLISPDLGAISGGIQVDFDARLGTDIVGATPTAGYIPTSNDHIWFLSSVDGSPFQLVQELTSQFSSTSAGFTSFSIPVPNNSSSEMRLKLKVQKAQSPSNSEFFIDVDNFAISLLTSAKNRQTSDFLIQIQPNPTSGTCNLIVGDGWGSRTNVEVYNILGTKILEIPFTPGKMLIDLSDQKSGIYLVKISEGKLSQIKRLIVK